MISEEGDPSGPPTSTTTTLVEEEKISQTQNIYDLTNRYRSTDSGPYLVYMEHIDKNLGRLFPMKVGYFLQECPSFKNDILNIKSIGLKRVKVEFKSFDIANSLVDHEIMKKNNLVAFIPKFYTQKKGIIRMVDTFFSEEFLKKEIISEIPIVEVKRMKRRATDPETKQVSFVDRQMVIVTFLGNKIPDTLKINLVRFTVDPYVHPVIQCFKCLRYGHTSVQCRGKPRCKTCGNEHNNDEECEKFCIHCNSNEHTSVSKECSIYIKQQNIKKTMAFENISFKEAEFVVENPSYAKISTNNRFDVLKNLENFPELAPPSQSNSQSSFLLKKPKASPIYQKNESQIRKRKHITPPTSPSTSSRPSVLPPASQTPKRRPPLSYSPCVKDIIVHQNQIISQISSFIFKILKEPNTIDENKIKEQLVTILTSKEDVGMECISISDEEYY